MKAGARAETPPGFPAGAPAIRLSRKAELRRIAVRDYAGLRLHARNCPDCVPGATDADPPRINRVCRLGMAGKAQYEQAYRAWVDCSEEGA
jgi:hypothetical protein